MKKNENSSSSSSQVIGVIVYIIAFLASWYFVSLISKNSAETIGKMQASAAISPAEIAKRQSITSAISGVIAQLQLLLSAFIVIGAPKKGYVASLVMNALSLASCAMSVITRHSYSNIPGLVVPVATIILVTIIQLFASKVNQKNAELSRNYEQLMETNRIIKDKDEKLTYLAYYDVLTSLPNRHLFIEKIDESIANNSNTPFSVILADIDNFKLINNTYGSSSGDVLLASYAEKFKILCGENVFLGRIGGNEYGFILQGNLSEANILNFIEKVQNILSEPVQIGSDIISATASFGIASYPNNALNSSDILNCINSAVSFAKSNGKNRPCFYEQY